MGVWVVMGLLVMSAVASATPTRWTLDAAVRRAIEQHPRLAASRADRDAALLHIGTAGRLDDPMAEVMLMERGNMEMEGTSYGARQMIPFPGKLRAERRMARFQAEQAEAEYAQAGLDLRSRVQKAFFERLGLDQQVAIERSNARLLQHYRATTETRYATGEATFNDPLSAAAEAEAARARVTQLELAQRAATRELAYLLNLPPEAPIALAMPRRKTAFPLSRDQLLDRLTVRHPQLRKAQAASDEAASGVSKAKAGFGPDLEAGVSYVQRDLPGSEPAVTTSIGLSVPLNIWRHRAEVAEAQAAWQASRRRQSDVEQRLRARLLAAYDQMQAAYRAATQYRSAVLPRAEATIRAGETAYQSQKLSFINLVELIQQQREHQLTYWETYTEYERRRAELERLAAFEPEEVAYEPAH